MLIYICYRLAQISLAEWNQGWTQTFRPNIWKANMFVFLWGTFSFFTVLLKCTLLSGACFKVNVYKISLTWSFQGRKQNVTPYKRRANVRITNVHSVMQSDGNSWKIDTFLKGYNFRTNDLILILKTQTRPYTCLAKVIFCS